MNGKRALEIGGTAALLLTVVALLGAWLHYRSLNEQLMVAVSAGDAPRTVSLLGRGADPQTRFKDRPLVFAAIFASSGAITKALIVAGADPNVRDNLGRTPLMFAAARCDLDIIAILLRFGADVNASSPDGSTSLMRAASQVCVEVVRRLLKAGARKDLRDGAGNDAEACARKAWMLYTDEADAYPIETTRGFRRKCSEIISLLRRHSAPAAR